MKKLVSIILTLLTAASIAVGLAGCKDSDLPEMTAEAPVFIRKLSDEYINYGDGLSCLKMEELEEYIQGEYKEICNETPFLLYPADLKTDFHKYAVPPLPPSFTIIGIKKDERMTNVLSTGGFGYFDKDLGGRYGDTLQLRNYTIEFNFVFQAFENEITDNELKLEFGGCQDEFNDKYNNYINVYYGNTCVGTCYYVAYVKIPTSWYENYFKENLSYGVRTNET